MNNDFYYDLEDALDARSEYDNDYSDLARFNIVGCLNIDDIFINALLYKYGINKQKDLNESTKLLKSLLDTEMKAFAYNQLADVGVSGDYLKLAIQYGHRTAMYRHADLLFATCTFTENSQTIFSLACESLRLGYNDACFLLIDCYKLLGDYKNISKYYKHYILHSNNSHCVSDYITVTRNFDNDEENCNIFIQTLMELPHHLVKTILITNIHLFNDNIMMVILQELKQNNCENKNVLENLLHIFNIDAALYKNFMVKVLT